MFCRNVHFLHFLFKQSNVFQIFSIQSNFEFVLSTIHLKQKTQTTFKLTIISLEYFKYI